MSGLCKGDDFFKHMTGAALSFGVTGLFALYHGYLGLGLPSVWHKSVCIFYLLLMAIRGSIVQTEKDNKSRTEYQQNLYRRRTFIVSSVLLLALNVALMLPIALMVVMAAPVNIGLIPAIAMAAYTAYKITMASVHFCRQKKAGGNILAAELRTVNFIDALVSILTLQNTLIMVNQSGVGNREMFLLSAVSSTAIYALVIAITVHMLVRGSKQLRALSQANGT